MGAGSCYSYRHFILIDEAELAPGWVELEDGEECPGTMDEGQCWDEDRSTELWDDFKKEVMIAFNAVPCHKCDGKSVIIGRTDKHDILINSTGGYPALWLRAYTIGAYEDDERTYKLNRIARNGFNKLIRMYTHGCFLTPTSDMTSMAFGKNADGTTDLYVAPYSWWKNPPTDLEG